MVMKKTASLLKGKPENYDGLWLSVSKAKTFDDCKAKYRFNYIERLPRKTWSFHVFGKFAHKILEHFHEARLEGDPRPDHELMSWCFKAAANEFKKDLTSDQKKKGFEISNEYLTVLAQKRSMGTLPEVTGVERKFYVDIGGEVLLNGMIDVEQIDPDGVLHLADYKTSKSTKYVKKDFFQLMTYAFVLCVEDPSIKRIRVSYVMLRHGFAHITKEFDREEIMKIQDKLLKYAEDIKGEKLYRPNTTPLCSYCDFAEHCPEGLEFIRNKRGSQANYGAQDWA